MKVRDIVSLWIVNLIPQIFSGKLSGKIKISSCFFSFLSLLV